HLSGPREPFPGPRPAAALRRRDDHDPEVPRGPADQGPVERASPEADAKPPALQQPSDPLDRVLSLPGLRHALKVQNPERPRATARDSRPDPPNPARRQGDDPWYASHGTERLSAVVQHSRKSTGSVIGFKMDNLGFLGRLFSG